MRILYFGNNWTGLKILEWLCQIEEQVVGLVIHPPQSRKYGDEMIRAANLGPEEVFDGSQLHRPDVMEAIRKARPDIGISVLFGYILREGVLGIPARGCVNLHMALLPYNRGANPNVWSIIEATPAGVSLHYVDGGVDTGDVIAQREVPVSIVDTGQTLYRKLELASIDLFKEAWPALQAGHPARVPQASGRGTSHRVRDLDEFDKIHLDGTYTARQLIDLIRARTFPPYRGAYFEHNGRRVYLRMELIEDSSIYGGPDTQDT